MKKIYRYFDINESYLSGSVDVLALLDADGNIFTTDFHVRFGKYDIIKVLGKLVSIKVNGVMTSVRMIMGNDGIAYFYYPGSVENDSGGRELRESLGRYISIDKTTIISLKPSPSQIREFNIQIGRNDIEFRVDNLQFSLKSSIYLWRNTDQFVISDIDGTVSRSDMSGYIAPFMLDTSFAHRGISEFYNTLLEHDYRIIYLSSRALGQSIFTKNYIFKLINQDGFLMPPGPVIVSEARFFSSLRREIFLRNSHEFKIKILSEIQEHLGKGGRIVYGFGNRDTDFLAYKEVGIEESNIFIINRWGELRNSRIVTSYYGLLESLFGVVPDGVKEEE